MHGLRRVPLGAVRPADLRPVPAQQGALPFVLLAVRLSAEQPLLDGSFSAGDLLLASVTVTEGARAARSRSWRRRLRGVAAGLPGAAVRELPRGSDADPARSAARGWFRRAGSPAQGELRHAAHQGAREPVGRSRVRILGQGGETFQQ